MEFSYALSKEMQHKAFISTQDQLCIRTTNDKLNFEIMRQNKIQNYST